MMRPGVVSARAFAKLNLGLRVLGVRPDGYHELRGRFQSIDWSDALRLEARRGSEAEDEVTAPFGRSDLAWRAVVAARRWLGVDRPVALTVDKRLPVAAGLGGGSADAAAAVAATAVLLGADPMSLQDRVGELGADVPFCYLGGTAWVEGIGDVVTPEPLRAGYAVAVVVPPVEVATPQVYGAFDRVGAAGAPAVATRDLPPTLRDDGPIVNELYPAAVAVAPEIDAWRGELATAWGRPVAMSGSGPSLFAFFVDLDEARDALDVVPVGARAAEAAAPIGFGWEVEAAGAPPIRPRLE